MKYIDKGAYLLSGHRITDDYLDGICRVEDGTGSFSYQNVDYVGTFVSSGAKAEMQHLALASQRQLCCYCMRDLHMQNQRVTLEHIIPQSVDSVEFKKYTNLGIKYLTTDDVIRTSDFTGVPNMKIGARPHTVAFENLVVSCDGTFPDKAGISRCCNNRRGNAFVYPAFYVSVVENEIRYSEDGGMHPGENCAHPDEYRRTIANVHLNCQNLKDIRRLWYLFDGEDYQVLVSCLSDRDLRNRTLVGVLFKKAELVKRDSDILTKFMKDEYWRTFLLYHWFHHKLHRNIER